MSRRHHPADRRRGRHKKHTSPETKRWQQEQMQPRKPVYLDDETYQKLSQLRETL